MKKNLTRVKRDIYHFVDGKKVVGVHDRITGDVTDLRGNVTDLRGNVTGLWGDVDECEITDEERKIGVNVSDLVA